jgi:uncharacterized membrane protein
MAAPQSNGLSRRDSKASAGRVAGWIPVAVALTAVAGMTAVRALRSGQPDRGTANGKRRNGASAGEPDVERSLTIGKTADELHRRWRDPETLARIMAGFATVRAGTDGRMHWTVEGPLGRTYAWDSGTVDDRPSEGVGWRSLPGADIPNEGSVRFRPAPADRGTVVTLRFRFNPPGGALGDAALKFLGHKPLDLAADGVLRRFKSFVETGEIPTTERQPAARADTH